ncbi:putative coiled-coil domain-containing protein 26 [Manis javanica]|nr:putative coiled-coil domain-containing protein 26 [Manis javanica]
MYQYVGKHVAYDLAQSACSVSAGRDLQVMINATTPATTTTFLELLLHVQPGPLPRAFCLPPWERLNLDGEEKEAPF